MAFEKKVSIGTIIDAYYNNGLWLTIKEDSLKKDYFFDFNPYFYMVSSNELNPQDVHLISSVLPNVLQIIKTPKDNAKNVYKIVFDNIESLVKARELFLKETHKLSTKVVLYEYDIPFIERFFLDNNLSNFKKIKFVSEDNHLLSYEVIGETNPSDLMFCTFDIEVLPPTNDFPNPKFNEILSICVEDKFENKFVFAFCPNMKDSLSVLKKEYESKIKGSQIFLFDNEVSLLSSFSECLSKIDPDIIFTYNGDSFDFEYIFKRYKLLTGNDFTIGNRQIHFHNKGNKSVYIDGVIHFDVYVLMRLLNHLGVFNFPRLDLNTLYPKLMNKSKLSLPPQDMRSCFLNHDFFKIIVYNQDDVLATHDLALNYYSIVYEISRLINSPISDVLRTSVGAMVERRFMSYYINNNLLIPNKPSSETISERVRYKFSGAYVHPPISGLHKNIAVVDFRSYHISLLLSYNISPDTVDIEKDNSNKNPLFLGHSISTNHVGFVPKLLKELLDSRIVVKEQMKGLSKDSQEYKSLYAKQYAQKILLASTYGYMGFSGARWYCKTCLEIMYHLVRTKIQDTITVFEEEGHQVIYGDTDSCFVHFQDLTKLKTTLDKINKSLPNDMYLELQDVYKSGLFVMARGNDKVAKKKYALLDFQGNLIIKGFEFVRRDWCPLVKETQRKVLELILDKEDPISSINYVRSVISDLREKKFPNSKLIIQSAVHKDLSKYKTINPAMSAISFAKKQGHFIKNKGVVDFIITNYPGSSISDKARLAEYVKEKDYDVDYYINHQLIPAIYPILEIFNVSKDELLTGVKQKGLKDFFK